MNIIHRYALGGVISVCFKNIKASVCDECIKKKNTQSTFV